MIDPDAIVIGGGLSEIDALYSVTERALPRYVFHAGPEETRPRPVVLKNRWGATSGLRGAAWLPALKPLVGSPDGEGGPSHNGEPVRSD
jgi:fructokinase